MAGTRASLALLRKKVKVNWTEKHRNVARKIFLAGGWTHKRLFDIGWSDVRESRACQMEEGTEKHMLYHCLEWHAVGRRSQRLSRNGNRRRRCRRKSGNGKEVSLRILSVKANGIEVASV